MGSLTNAVVSVVVDSVPDDLDVVAVVVGVESVLVVVVNVVVLPFAPVVSPGVVPEPLQYCRVKNVSTKKQRLNMSHKN